MRILLVEDDLLIRLYIKRVLGRLGYNDIHEASSGDEAMRLAAENNPKLVFLDMKLQGDIDGMEIALWLRDQGEENQILVYMSAYEISLFKDQMRDNLFDHILQKPVTEHALAEICHTVSPPNA